MTVQVLMSTFDGERYLRQQVDSILAQTEPLRLLVRDDGSTDGTPQILHTYADDLRVDVELGDNLGVPDAFFRLLDVAPDADLFALADQDDVWAPDKLQRAVAALSGVTGPALYCARVLVTDEQLRPLYPHELPVRGPSFANALVQNIALGCTVVLNREARELVRGRWPTSCVMHDAWLYLVLAGCGTVLYDDHLVVQYRQHAGNAVGMGSGPASRLAGRVRRQLSADGPRKHSRQDRELLRLFAHDLRPDALQQLEELLAAQESANGRARYALGGPAHRQTRGSDLVLKVLQVVGRV
ncbi:MAG: spsA [Frankiales bacterium]|nr:spsA [Frankiales bacterium]MCW2665467.1 spsA [Frankiales bacterium]